MPLEEVKTAWSDLHDKSTHFKVTSVVPAPVAVAAEPPTEAPVDDDAVAWSNLRKDANRQVPVSLLETHPFIFEGQPPTDVHVPEVSPMELLAYGNRTITTPNRAQITPNPGNILTTEAIQTFSMRVHNVWNHWVQGGGSCNSCTTGLNSWPTSWVGTSGTTSAIHTQVSNMVWTKWVQDSVEYRLNHRDGEVQVLVRGRAQEVRVKTSEEIAAEQVSAKTRKEEYERYQLAQKIEQETKAKEQKMARARAKKLLVSCLNKEQKECYAKNGYFDVKVSGKTYRIHQGTHGNVRLLDEKGNSKIKYCAQPDGVPEEDAMLAQKLSLEFGEEAFLKVANATIMRN